jgi:hypothetical protein
MANAPQVRQDGRRGTTDLPDRLSELFLARGLDTQANQSRYDRDGLPMATFTVLSKTSAARPGCDLSPYMMGGL